MEIKIYGNPVLRKKSIKVDVTPDIIELAHEMIDTMYQDKGVGLAAPQIGKNIRLVVIDLMDDTGPKILINPEIYWQSKDNVKMEEGCLSIPGISALVSRPSSIKYRYTDENGKTVDRIADELEARVIQHELDHLDGVLYIDRVSPTKLMLLKKELNEIKKKGEAQK